jgi:hypothetical protein
MPIAHVGLSINLGSDPIEGSVVTGGQEPQPFCGWVELAAAIEGIRAQAPPSDPRVDGGPPRAATASRPTRS